MPEPTSGPRPSDKWIPWYIVGFFVILVAVLVPMCVIAVHTHTGVVTDSAYEKGLSYNNIISKAAAQASLNWKSHLTLMPSENKLHVDFQLYDAVGKPIEKADVKLWLIRPTHDNMDQTATMADQGDGDYHVELPLPDKGQWEASVSATYNNQNFQTTKRVVLP